MNSIIFIPSDCFRPVLIYNFLGLWYYRGNGIKVPQPRILNYLQKYRKENWVPHGFLSGFFFRVPVLLFDTRE